MSLRASVPIRPTPRAGADRAAFFEMLPVRHWLNDPAIRAEFRGVDQRWFYGGVLPRNLYGFNPYTSAVYLPRYSVLETYWTEGTASDAGAEPDALLRELLTVAHEYLHAWTVLAINASMPDLGFGTSPITAETFERYVYCHLLTEAAAVAALDYWYLGDVSESSEYRRLGLTLEGGIASPLYRPSFVSECRRYSAGFDPLTPSFLSDLVVFYCTGSHPIFSNAAAEASPLLREWIRQEVMTQHRQLAVTRGWLSTLSMPGACTRALTAPVACDEPWMVRLRTEVSERLWQKIRHDDATPLPALEKPGWSRPFTVDYRYVNLNMVSEPPPKVDAYYLRQLIAQRDYSVVAPEIRRVLAALADDVTSYDLAAEIARKLPRLPHGDEPAALLFET